MNSEGGPTVSVVVGAYNEEDVIADTIQSILGQTFDNFEIVVVDDGSSDRTAQIVESFQDSRVRLVSFDQNQGLPSALNRGIQEARGEYIARADADERSLPFRIQRQSEILDSESSIQAVACWYCIIGQDKTQIVDIEISTDRDFGVNDLLENGPGVAHGSMMIRKEALLDVNGYREEFQLAQDYDLWLRMADTFGKGWLHIIPDVLYERNINAYQLQKRHRQRIFGDAARESAKIRRAGHSDEKLLSNLDERAERSEGPNYSQKELAGMYHYHVGTQLLTQNKRSRARQHLLKALWFAPTRPRPWYRLGLSILPPEHRKTIQNWVKKQLLSTRN